MAHKRVVMKGGNGKSVSLPASLADGLVKMRKATYADEPKPAVKAKAKPEPKRQAYQTRQMTAAKPVAAASALETDEDLAPLRAEYESLVGRKPWVGWDAAALRAKVAEHKKAKTSE